jgi:hypothetical protein
MDCSLARLTSVIKLGYYVPALFDTLLLKNSDMGNSFDSAAGVTTRRLPIRLLGDYGVMFANNWQKIPTPPTQKIQR